MSPGSRVRPTPAFHQTALQEDPDAVFAHRDVGLVLKKHRDRRRLQGTLTRTIQCARVSLAGASALVLAFAHTASAQGPFRQDVVVTAAATPVELGTVTRTLTVITRGQIQRLPVRSIADDVRLTAAVDVRARGERGVQTDFAIPRAPTSGRCSCSLTACD